MQYQKQTFQLPLFKNINIKCHEFLCQVVQKYIINNLVFLFFILFFKETVNHPGQSILVYVYMLFSQAITSQLWFTKWPTKGGGRQNRLLLHYKEHQDKLYKESYGFSTIMTVESRPKVRNDKTIYSLQQPTLTKHSERKTENCVKG